MFSDCSFCQDLVEWDDDFPPRLGEQFMQVVHSTPLLRFVSFGGYPLHEVHQVHHVPSHRSITRLFERLVMM